MKCKLLYILLFGFIVLGLGSCKKDFLDLYPITSVSSASFYKTKVHFDQAIVGAYNQMRNIALNGIFMDEQRSDNAFFTYYSADRSLYWWYEASAEFIQDAASGPQGSPMVNRYNGDYAGLSSVNTILGRIDASQMTSNEKASVRAEALFLRAFYYFDLVKYWGPVPLIIKEVTSDIEAFQPNSTVDTIYKQIIDDVSEAIQIGLPIPSSFPQSGHATMGAAKMLRAYVYMTKPTREYALAEADLLDVTNMNYGLLSNYADFFKVANKNSKESILEVQYVGGIGGQNSTFCWQMIPKCTNTEFLMGVKEANLWKKYMGWCVPTQEMIDSYEIGDLRLPASIVAIEGILEGEIFKAEAVKPALGYKTPAGKGSRYMVAKYWHPPYSMPSNSGENFPIYRYSDALLLLAECLVAENKADQALNYLNQVRARAGLPALLIATADNVANERRHEFAFENKRWTDLVRTGKAIEVMTQHGVRMKALYPWLLPQTFNVTETQLLMPFYFRELAVNKYLKQNPGY